MAQYRYSYPRPDDIDFGRILRRHWGKLIAAVVVLVILGFLATSFYSIETDSQGVVLRFGKYSRTTKPGLRAKFPWPIETVYEVPVRKTQSLEFGFATAEPGKVTEYAQISPQQQEVARMLTGDLNLTHVEWIVQYRIKAPRKYLFQVGGEPTARRSVEGLIRNVSEAVMRQLVGDVSVDEILTIGRMRIAADAEVQIQEMLDGFEAGVDVVTVKLQSATPPQAVKDSFDEVNRARQRKEQIVNEAKGERNRRIPAAEGKRDQAILEAEGYRERVTREMQGRANAFGKQLAEYEKAPEITRARLYLQTMEDVLTGVDDKMVIDASVRSMLPLLNLDARAKGAEQ